MSEIINDQVLKRYEERPRRWWQQLLITLAVAIVLVWSGTSVQFRGIASRGADVARGILHGLIHLDTNLLINATTEGVPYLLYETVAIALLGTLFGGLLAIPFSFLAANNIVPKWVGLVFRTLILLIRTIPSMVWALIWIRVTGPGAMCGVVTQSICSIGMISKMYITAIEDIDTRILESLDASGCTAFQKIRYGILPQLTANFASTMIYRFDINIKDATTLGIVGAGGIGASLLQSINSRRWSMVGAFLFGMIILMLFIEYASTKLRKRLAQGNK